MCVHVCTATKCIYTTTVDWEILVLKNFVKSPHYKHMNIIPIQKFCVKNNLYEAYT